MTISSKINIKNRRASFEYHLLERFEAGVRLLGTEIKSIRQGKANINDSFCSFIDGELYIRNMHIAEYSHGSFYNHEAKRNRKLLLHKREIKKLETKLQERGFTIIPLRIFINNRGFAKIEIALAQGKKLYDKREAIKERDNKRELARFLK
ncbi:MAG TPA: SsrA-binding protein SmpB [Candidatus Sphingobacterium stercoripullorum]|uniref:SsrA-binding protein n=1 Tax=Candidatus Sphingobacterium stercoripullorum TaxID=2838759 RepID=A0A9D2AXI3_9SPHI|nr:SsrA-binding protein SmpB [Candidatus Sphingobacterium stercoripullorum]HLR49617.1 SsrA-binding protein SmpB [Candidatus Sphingobacterium stercoripullorum]